MIAHADETVEHLTGRALGEGLSDLVQIHRVGSGSAGSGTR